MNKKTIKKLNFQFENEGERAFAFKKVYGFDPRKVGLRHRAYWVVGNEGYEYEFEQEKDGNLCVKARDGGSNEPDCSAGSYGEYIGSVCDSFDITYRYYFYEPLLK